MSQPQKRKIPYEALSETARRKRSQAIREWARLNGILVDPRGRVPIAIVERYDQAMAEQRATAH